MSISNKVLYLLIIALSVPVFVLAQPGGGGPCPTPPCGPPVPISGIEYLVGVGLLFGLRFIRRKRNL